MLDIGMPNEKKGLTQLDNNILILASGVGVLDRKSVV